MRVNPVQDINKTRSLNILLFVGNSFESLGIHFDF